MKNIFKKNINNQNKAVFSLVEVLIACTIMSMVTLALMSAASKGIDLSGKALKQVQASDFMEEGVEAVKSIRDNNWMTISTLSLNTNYYLSFNTNTNTWSLGTTPVALIDGFTRAVVFSAVSRNGNSDIYSSGTIDTGIKRAKVTVSWISSGTTVSKDITFYLANIFN